MQMHAPQRPQRSTLLGGAAGAVLLSLAGAAAAEQSATVSQQGVTVDTIVVTAQHRSENLQNVPISVTAIAAKDVKALGIKETEDIGQLASNVQIVGNSGAGNQPLITIRGVGLNDFDTNNAGPNGIYVDDVYISAPSAQAFAVFDVGQVQILKGPQGTLYGKNTSGGAVLFTSNRPTDTMTGDLNLEYGNYNTLSLNGGVGGPINDQLDFRIAGVFNHSDGFMHNTLNGEPASGSNSEAVRLQLLYKPNDRLKILFSSSIGDMRNLPEEYRHIGVFVPGTQSDGSPTFCSPAQAYAGGCVDMFGYGTPRKYYDGAWSRTQQLRNFNNLDILRVDYSLGSIKLTSISSFEHNDKFFPENSDAGPNNLLAVNYGVKSNTFTQEFRAAQSTDHYNWVAGLYYLHETLSQNQPLYLFGNGDQFGGFGVAPGPGAFDGITQRSFDISSQGSDSVAAFGQGDYSFNRFTLTLGGRVTYERRTFEYTGSTQFQSGGTGNYGPLQDIVNVSEAQAVTNFTWKGGLSYHFTDRVMGYFSASTGFKSGDFNGSFLSNDPAQILIQLKPVNPEKVTAYELGVKSSFFDQRLILDAAVFYNNYQNEQIFAQVPETIQTAAGPVAQITNILTNAKQAHTEGLEIELTAVPVRGLTLSLQPSWLEAKLDRAGLPSYAGSTSLDGNDLAYSPHFSLVATAEYKYWFGSGDDIDFRWDSSYRTHQFLDATNDPYIQQNGYWLHNLNVTFESLKGWNVGFYVRNLTGTRYATTGSDLGNPFGLVELVIGQPRTYGVKLGYHF